MLCITALISSDSLQLHLFLHRRWVIFSRKTVLDPARSRVSPKLTATANSEWLHTADMSQKKTIRQPKALSLYKLLSAQNAARVRTPLEIDWNYSNVWKLRMRFKRAFINMLTNTPPPRQDTEFRSPVQHNQWPNQCLGCDMFYE